MRQKNMNGGNEREMLSANDMMIGCTLAITYVVVFFPAGTLEAMTNFV